MLSVNTLWPYLLANKSHNIKPPPDHLNRLPLYRTSRSWWCRDLLVLYTYIPYFLFGGRGDSSVVYVDARRVECHPGPAWRSRNFHNDYVGYAARTSQCVRGITGGLSTDHLTYRVIRNFWRDLPNCRVIEYHGVSIIGGFIRHLCYLYLLLRYKR